MADTTREVAEIISPRSAGRSVPASVSSRAPRLTSRDPHSRISKSFSRSKPSATSRSPTASKSRRSSAPTSPELTVIEESAEDMQLARTEVVPASKGAPRESIEVVPTEEEAPEGGGEVSLIGEGAPVVEIEVASKAKDTSKDGVKSKPAPAAPRPKMATVRGAVTLKKAVGKRAPPSEAPTIAPASKRAHGPQRPALALPPLEKEKMPVGLLSSASENEVLNAEEITPQSPASLVAELLRERMFGGVTEASYPRLFALTGLLDCSTLEQVAFCT